MANTTPQEQPQPFSEKNILELNLLMSLPSHLDENQWLWLQKMMQNDHPFIRETARWQYKIRWPAADQLNIPVSEESLPDGSTEKIPDYYDEEMAYYGIFDGLSDDDLPFQ